VITVLWAKQLQPNFCLAALRQRQAIV